MLYLIARPAVLLSIALVLTVGAVSTFAVAYRVGAAPPPAEWPSLVMTYEATGAFDKIGDAEPLAGTLRFRLTHNANGDWREEIIAAPDVVTRVGTFNRQGSYQAVEGRVYTDYDSTSGETTAETLEEGENRIPRSMLYPMPLATLDEHYAGERVLTPTNVRVCFSGKCQDNAPGWLYEVGGARYIYADDQRGIPIGLSYLNITEVSVSGNQRAVAR